LWSIRWARRKFSYDDTIRRETMTRAIVTANSSIAVIAQRVQFTVKADGERLRDGLTVEEVLESIVNANAIKKVLRSRSPSRAHAGERLYVIESPTFSGTWVYTKGVIRNRNGQETFYVLVSSKLAT
jgi:hypothetical protein